MNIAFELNLPAARSLSPSVSMSPFNYFFGEFGGASDGSDFNRVLVRMRHNKAIDCVERHSELMDVSQCISHSLFGNRINSENCAYDCIHIFHMHRDCTAWLPRSAFSQTNFQCKRVGIRFHFIGLWHHLANTEKSFCPRPPVLNGSRIEFIIQHFCAIAPNDIQCTKRWPRAIEAHLHMANE